MGLLSDPKTREKIVNVISKYNNKLSFLCYVAGVCYFLALAHRPFNAGVYMSENALIPGLVEADFFDDNGAGSYFKDYKEYHKQLKEEVAAVPDNKREDSILYEIPTTWLVSQFRAIGLEAYVHNYTFRYPLSILQNQVMSGQNVYGILRAPRAAGTEALVLSVPFRPPGSDYEKTAAGMALILGVAKGFRKRTYWAKDIIFLVTDNEEIGMQAWLSAYHHAYMEYITPEELPGRSGSIQAAINLELGTDSVNRINVKLEGLNGQLPNLDLVNTVNRLCKKERIPSTIQKRPDPSSPFTFDGWEHAVQTMLHMMWSQASGRPSGNHGLFHRYHIEAVTLQGLKTKNTKYTAGLEQVGRVIEGIFRSLNNLLERFHQSFFFYLLPTTDRYVSIGLYFPPFGLLAAPILIQAVALWISYSFETSEKEKAGAIQETPSEKEKAAKKKQMKSETEKEIKKEDKDDKLLLPPSSGFSAVIPQFVMATLFGVGSYFAPTFFVGTAATLHMAPGEGLMMGAIAVQLSAMAYPYMIKRKAAQKKNLSGANWKLLKCLGLLLLGLVVFATALMNISLAFFITAMVAPIVVCVRPSHSRLRNLLQFTALFAISPLVLLFSIGAINDVITSSAFDVTTLVKASWEGAQRAALLSAIDAHMYGSWTFGLVTVLFWPIWLIFWSLLWTEPL